MAGHSVLHDRILQDVHDVLYMAPAIPLVLVLALIVARRRRDFGVLSPLAVVGGGLSFDLLAYVDNSIQPWFRYFITVVPLEVLLVGSFFATIPALFRFGASVLVPVRRHLWFGTGAALC